MEGFKGNLKRLLELKFRTPFSSQAEELIIKCLRAKENKPDD